MWRLRCRTSVLTICSRLWYRLVRYYQLPPWPLGQLANDNVSELRKDQVVRDLLDANLCCLDAGCGARLRSRGVTFQGARHGRQNRLLRNMFMHMKSNTIPVEERFKRIRVHSWNNHGRAQDAATMKCNYGLGEWRSMHTERKQLLFRNWKRRRGGTQSKHIQTTAFVRRTRLPSAVLAYVNMRKATAPIQLGETRAGRHKRIWDLAVFEWSCLLPAQKAQWSTTARQGINGTHRKTTKRVPRPRMAAEDTASFFSSCVRLGGVGRLWFACTNHVSFCWSLSMWLDSRLR